MKNGFRQKAQPSKKQVLNDVGRQLQNVQMACRVLQIGLQQLSTSYQNITGDMDRLTGLLAHLQYKQDAVLKLSGLSEDAVNAKADELRLTEYNEKSDKEDLEKNYQLADVVEPDSVVIITSSSEKKEREIFRSKFILNDCGVPELQQKLVGAKVGDKVETTLNGDKHIVELLAIRKAPPKLPQEIVEAAAEAATKQAIPGEMQAQNAAH